MKFTHKHFDAAELVFQAYERTLITTHTLDSDGVQAFITSENVLVIPGTETIGDWWDNINVGWGAGKKREWHKGFFRQALVIYKWLEEINVKIELATGHSLGSASGQIVFCSKKYRDIPTIFFASPRPLGPKMTSIGYVRILNICRKDDRVTTVPLKFKHVGEVVWLDPTFHMGADHDMRLYREAMYEANE